MMIKRLSIHKLLLVLMMFTLILPGFAAANGYGGPGHGHGPGNGSDNGDEVVGSLTIHKYSQEKDAEKEKGTGEGGQHAVGDPLEGVTFTLTQTHQYDPETDKWTEVSGTPEEYVTDADGKIEISPIPLGRYKVEETDGPPNVVLNTQEYYVDIPMTNEDGTDTNYDVHIYPKNEIIRGKVTLTKYGEKKKHKLKGVTFNLYKKGESEPIDTNLKTGLYGKLSVKNLEYGKYYFQEVSTVDGYLLNGEKVYFSIEKQGEHKKVSLYNYKEPEVEKSVDKQAVNRGETVQFSITVDLPGDIQSYEKFDVIDLLDDRLEYIDGSESSPAGFTFSKNDQELKWTGDPSQLQPGNVTITFDAKVSEDAKANDPIENEATIDYDNRYVTDSKTTPPVTVIPTVGSLTVIKQDGNDNDVKLQGAEFELRNENGDVVATGVSGTDGVVDFNGATNELDYGTYELIETKAPNGYNKLRNPIEVVIDEEESEVTITVDNYKSGWELPKTGGIGTVFFTLIGLTLMSSAAWMYFRRQRSEEV